MPTQFKKLLQYSQEPWYQCPTGSKTVVYIWLQKKPVCMFFSRQPTEGQQPSVMVGGERLDVIEHFKYLGVIFDSNLTFMQNVKKVTNTITFIFLNFKHRRSFLTMQSAKTYMHAMISTHIFYCYTTLSHTSESTLKPIKSFFKGTIKTLAKKKN